MSQKLYELALMFMVDIGPVTARNLVSYCGGVEAVFRETEKSLMKIPGVGAHKASLDRRQQALTLAEAELKRIEKLNITTHFYLDTTFPRRLKAYEDSPILLYQKGGMDLNQDRMLAVVGTRTPTEYGKIKCDQIIEELAQTNVVIVSGLAYGIDAISHKSSLKQNMKTIGVLGNGLPEIYPKSHADLAKKMLNSGGDLVSQFPCHALPDREHFPMRNKTVAYMTDATLVIESKASGGSMITANFAFHNHKELMALPGRTIDPISEGCNKLIKANMAQLVTSGDDVMSAMAWDRSVTRKAVQQQLFLDLNPTETRLVNLIRDEPNIHIDLLSKKADLTNSHLATLLLQLELNGAIRQTVGKRYILSK